jgi:hypothetical protein
MARHLTSVEEYRALLAGAMPEDDLLVAVQTELTLRGWRWHHIRRADLAGQQGDPGFPDIVAVHRGQGRLLVAELKAQAGRYEVGQREWLEGFEGAVAETFTWRPADLDAIRKVLR